MRTQEIYGRFINGDSLSDEELLSGIPAFKIAADAIYKLGPEFNITAKEANSVYLRLLDYASNRGILKEET